VLEVALEEFIDNVVDPTRVRYAIVPVNSLSPPSVKDYNIARYHHHSDDDRHNNKEMRIDGEDSIQPSDRYLRETGTPSTLLTDKKSDSASSAVGSRSDNAKRMADMYDRKLSTTRAAAAAVETSPVMSTGDQIMDLSIAVKDDQVDSAYRIDSDTDADIDSRITDLLQLLKVHYVAKSKDHWRSCNIGDDDSTPSMPSMAQFVNSSKVRRLEHMMLMQEQVQNITVNLAELSRSVLLCQQSLSKIIKGMHNS